MAYHEMGHALVALALPAPIRYTRFQSFRVASVPRLHPAAAHRRPIP